MALLVLLLVVLLVVELVFGVALFVVLVFAGEVGLGILVRCPRRVLFDGDDPGELDPPPPPVVVAINDVVVIDDEDGYDDLLGLVLGLALPPLEVVG